MFHLACVSGEKLNRPNARAIPEMFAGAWMAFSCAPLHSSLAGHMCVADVSRADINSVCQVNMGLTTPPSPLA